MTKRSCNPFLPPREYIPDGEPHVFGDRVYLYGSHDRFDGYDYCLNDYVGWSAPIDDLTDWRYEGVIFRRVDDPSNRDGSQCLFAPDVVQGPDGRYYLYYVLNKRSVVAVAVCDTPAGRYEFYGHVHWPDGTVLGEKPGDMPQFDPGVLREGDRTYMYTGFCWPTDLSRKGPTVTVLGPDMLTVIEDPRFIAPSKAYSAGTGFEGHEFYEAPSMRKIGDTYYFVYSSIRYSELCYATSKSPVEGFVYRGVIVSNNDFNIDTYKPAQKPMFYGGNNHGNFEKVGDRYYIFYHRHTNGTNFSRQACGEPIEILEDGSIPQVEMTSNGLTGVPFATGETIWAYTACNLFATTEQAYTGDPGSWLDARFPKITQEGIDDEGEPPYIANLRDGATAGFKYVDCNGVKKVRLTARGGHGAYSILTAWDGDVLGQVPVGNSTEWETAEAEISIPDGVHAIYLRYEGPSFSSLQSFTLLN